MIIKKRLRQPEKSLEEDKEGTYAAAIPVNGLIIAVILKSFLPELLNAQIFEMIRVM